MKQIYLIFLVLVFSLKVASVFCPCGADAEGACYDSCSPDKISEIPLDRISQLTPEQVAKYFDYLTSAQRIFLTSDQLAQIDPSRYGVLSQYNQQALVSALQSQGYSIKNLEGDLDDAHFEGNILVIGQNLFDAKTGNQIIVEANSDGTITFSNNNPTSPISFTNAEGIFFSKGELSVRKADYLVYHGSTSKKVQMFRAITTTFSVDYAERVSIEGINFDFIKNSSFTISDKNLVSVSITCDMNNTITKIKNIIPLSSEYFNIYCDKDDFYTLNYRKDKDTIEFISRNGTHINFFGVSSNITFNSTDDVSYFAITKEDPPKYFSKGGIVSFISIPFIEQIMGNCDISEANIDSVKGFTRVVLRPCLSIICPGDS